MTFAREIPSPSKFLGISLGEIIRYLAEGRRLEHRIIMRDSKKKGGTKKRGKRKDLRENGQIQKRRGGRRVGEEVGRRVDTFEEGSVDAVAPASQWLLRHSSARGRVTLRAVFGSDVRD